MSIELLPILISSERFHHDRNVAYDGRLRGWLQDESTTHVFATSYVAQLEAMESIGLLGARQQTRILLRPPDGFSRVDAERLRRRAQRVKGLEIRQLKGGAHNLIAHLKLLLLRHTKLGHAAILGSSNLTTRGICENLELNALVDRKCGGFAEMQRTAEVLWEQYSEDVRPENFTERIAALSGEEYGGPPHLLEFQRAALDDLLRYHAKVSGDGGALLSLPTGTGKTVIASRFLLERVLREPQNRVLWVAPQEELVVQAASTFACQHGFFRLPQLRVEPVSLLRSARDRRSLDTEYNVIFRVLNTAAREADGQRFDAVVIDEAHWGASEARAMLPSLLESLKVRFRLGLTATPYRSLPRDQGFLTRSFPHRVVPREDVELAVDAVGRPVLAKTVSESVATGVKISVDLRQLAAYELSDQALRVIKTKERNALVARTWDRRRHGRTLVFALDVEHANQLGAAFNRFHPDAAVQVLHTGAVASAGLAVVVAPTDESFSAEERRSVYSLFRNGSIDVLIAVNLYTTGVDFPGVESLFMARPTLSPVLYAQMLGRGRRGPAFGGTPQVNVVDFADQLSTHKELGARLMDLATERRFDDLRTARNLRWQRISESALHERARTASCREGQAALYRVMTERRFLKKGLDFTKDLGRTLSRAFQSERSPVRPEHTVEFWLVDSEAEAHGLELMVREFSPDASFRTREVSAPPASVRKKRKRRRRKARSTPRPADIVAAFAEADADVWVWKGRK